MGLEPMALCSVDLQTTYTVCTPWHTVLRVELCGCQGLHLSAFIDTVSVITPTSSFRTLNLHPNDGFIENPRVKNREKSTRNLYIPYSERRNERC